MSRAPSERVTVSADLAGNGDFTPLTALSSTDDGLTVTEHWRDHDDDTVTARFNAMLDSIRPKDFVALPVMTIEEINQHYADAFRTLRGNELNRKQRRAAMAAKRIGRRA